MNNKSIMELVRKHLSSGAEMESSARLCLADAVELDNQGRHAESAIRALKGLQYLVGCWHPDFKEADKFVNPT